MGWEYGHGHGRHRDDFDGNGMGMTMISYDGYMGWRDDIRGYHMGRHGSLGYEPD